MNGKQIINGAWRDVRVWLSACVIVGVAIANATGILKLPEKVEALAEDLHTEVVDRKDSVANLADTLDDYIGEQKILNREAIKRDNERKEAQDKREVLMLELIKVNSAK